MCPRGCQTVSVRRASGLGLQMQCCEASVRYMCLKPRTRSSTNPAGTWCQSWLPCTSLAGTWLPFWLLWHFSGTLRPARGFHNAFMASLRHSPAGKWRPFWLLWHLSGTLRSAHGVHDDFCGISPGLSGRHMAPILASMAFLRHSPAST